MTLSTQNSKASYAGNGVSKVFPVSFPFIRDADIVVLLSQDGQETTLQQGTHYALSGSGEPGGGSLTMHTPPATGQTLVIRRDPAIVQELDYVENSAFPAASHEGALDLLTMICQALDEKVRRAVLYPVSTPAEQIKDSRAFLETCEAARQEAQADAAQCAAQTQAAGAHAQAAALSALAAQQSVGGLRVSIGDAVPGTLAAKLVAGDGLAEALLDAGGNEALRLSLATDPDGGLETAQGLVRARLAPGGGLACSAAGLGANADQLQALLLALVGAWTRQQYAPPVAVAPTAGAVTLDADLHQNCKITSTEALTMHAPTNAAEGKMLFVRLYAATALGITWDVAFVKNADKDLPTAHIAGKDMFLQFYHDGVSWVLLGGSERA